MKRFIISILLAFFLSHPIFAQTPGMGDIQGMLQSQINDTEKQIAEKEKEISEAQKNKEDPSVIESLQGQLNQLKLQLSMMKNAGKSVNVIPSSMANQAAEQVESENQEGFSKIPKKKTELLSTIPQKEFTPAELQIYLDNTFKEAKQKLGTERVAEAQKLISLLENNPENIAAAGVAAWYNNAPAEAALLLLYAASKAPANANILNNCGAILNLCGLENKAIPILQYVLNSHPDNSTVLNNMGQGYAGLGETQKAMMYFARCIQQSPDHPEANATAAKIEEANGNTQAAEEYTEHSLRGAYSEERSDYYHKHKKSCKVNVLYSTKMYSHTEFFDPGSLHIPPNCRDWVSAESVYPVQESFRQMIKELTEKYSKIAIANQVTQTDIVNMATSPFNESTVFKMEALTDCYLDRKTELFEAMRKNIDALIAQQQTEQKEWEANYKKESEACPKVGDPTACLDKVDYKYCKLREALENKYNNLLADISDKYTQETYTEDAAYYNSMVYLTAMGTASDKVLASAISVLTSNFINLFPNYVMSTQCNPADKPECEKLNPANANNPNSPDIKDPQCPVGIKAPFGIVEVTITCKKFGIELGEGWKFSYEKDFTTRESTLAMGVGINADIPGILDAQASEKVYVKFDGNNQPIDVGVAGEAQIGIKGMTPVASADYTMGVNSGFNSNGKSLY